MFDDGKFELVNGLALELSQRLRGERVKVVDCKVGLRGEEYLIIQVLHESERKNALKLPTEMSGFKVLYEYGDYSRIG